jgi:hypothetical protein
VRRELAAAQDGLQLPSWSPLPGAEEPPSPAPAAAELALSEEVTASFMAHLTTSLDEYCYERSPDKRHQAEEAAQRPLPTLHELRGIRKELEAACTSSPVQQLACYGEQLGSPRREQGMAAALAPATPPRTVSEASPATARRCGSWAGGWPAQMNE